MRLIGVLLLITAHVVLVPSLAVAQPCQGWEGRFFNNTELTGLPAHTTCEQVIDFEWGLSAPNEALNADHFSARWTSVQTFPAAGLYQLVVTVEGGVRLFVNGAPLINAVEPTQGRRMLNAPYEVVSSGATAFISLEMVSWEGPASVKLEWSLASGGPNPAAVALATPTLSALPGVPNTSNLSAMGGGVPWYIEYFANTTLEGQPAAQESAPADGISRNYAGAAPAEGMDIDNWSARWTRPIDFTAGTYTFHLRADDSAKVFIDEVEILNQASFAEGATAMIQVQIPAGQHRLVVEFVELSGDSNLFLTWDPPLGTTLFPDGCNSATAGVNGGAAPCPDRVMENVVTGSTTTAMNVIVRAGPLRFRPAPSTNAAPMDMLHRGEQYVAVGRSADNIWVQLRAGQVLGWAMSEFLTLPSDINSLPITDGTVTTTTTTNSPSAAVIQIMPAAITPIPNATPNNTESAPPANIPITGVRARALGNMRLRAAPNTQSERLDGVDWGAEVEVIGRSADGFWIQIGFNGASGWSAVEWYEIISGDLTSLPITE